MAERLWTMRAQTAVVVAFIILSITDAFLMTTPQAWRPTYPTPSSEDARQSQPTNTSAKPTTPSFSVPSLMMSSFPSTKEVKQVTGSRKKRAVYLKHERDFFRQAARLESMESYTLVSTLTASMSFGALLGFSPAVEAAMTGTLTAKLLAYRALCSLIPVIAGMSAIFGLYATIMFSLTILYGKSALGSERDLEYEKFLRRTVRPRVHGQRCFTLSLGFFAVEAVLVLMEKTFFRPWFLVVFGTTLGSLFYLYRDWRLIFRMAEYIYED